MHDLLPKILCDLHRRASSFLICAKMRLPVKPVFAAQRETANPSRPAQKNCFFRRFYPAAPQEGAFSALFAPVQPPPRPLTPAFPARTPRRSRQKPAVPALFPGFRLAFFPGFRRQTRPGARRNSAFCPVFPPHAPAFAPFLPWSRPFRPPASRPAALPRSAAVPWDATCRPTRDPPPPSPRYTSPWRSVWSLGGPRTLAVSPGDRRPLSRKIPRNWGPGVFSPRNAKSRPVEGGKEDL